MNNKQKRKIKKWFGNIVVIIWILLAIAFVYAVIKFLFGAKFY